MKSAPFLQYVLSRIDMSRDVHFYTNTTIDTLDYSGTSLNSGSKVVFAAYGEVKRTLATEVPSALISLQNKYKPALALPGVIVLQVKPFTTYDAAHAEMEELSNKLQSQILN